MWPIVTDAVAWCVFWSVTILSLAKMAEPIEMPFWAWSRVGQKNRVLGGVQIPMRRGKFEGETLSAWQMAG